MICWIAGLNWFKWWDPAVVAWLKHRKKACVTKNKLNTVSKPAKDPKEWHQSKYIIHPFLATPTATTCNFPDLVSSTAAPEMGILPFVKDWWARSSANLTASRPAPANAPSSSKSCTSKSVIQLCTVLWARGPDTFEECHYDVLHYYKFTNKENTKRGNSESDAKIAKQLAAILNWHGLTSTPQNILARPPLGRRTCFRDQYALH